MTHEGNDTLLDGCLDIGLGVLEIQDGDPFDFVESAKDGTVLCIQVAVGEGDGFEEGYSQRSHRDPVKALVVTVLIDESLHLACRVSRQGHGNGE